MQDANRQLKVTMFLQRLLTIIGIILLFSGLLPSARSQTKNEVGLVIGATTTPSQTLSQQSCVGPTCDLTFNASLALGAHILPTPGNSKAGGDIRWGRLSCLSP